MLADFSLGTSSLDFYDVSMVDGYNLPVIVGHPVGLPVCAHRWNVWRTWTSVPGGASGERQSSMQECVWGVWEARVFAVVVCLIHPPLVGWRHTCRYSSPLASALIATPTTIPPTPSPALPPTIRWCFVSLWPGTDFFLQKRNNKLK